jgi:transcriptional antiterminator Rof (Rho-off)
MQNADYQPISCTFHDRLEDYSLRGATLPISYFQDDILITAEARIADVLAQNGADFAILALTNGSTVLVRLDKLVSVNGFQIPMA